MMNDPIAVSEPKSRKWISEAISKLDPHRDYAEIWKLSVIYRSNDAFMDLMYSITFPNFVVPNHGALAVLRDGSGKVFRYPERRMDDTSRHILIWSEFGPDHELTQRSIQSLNQLHAFWSKKYPGAFGHNDDYLYTMCYEATLFHRLLRRVGLAGMSPNEQIAGWEFWSRMAKLFRNGESGLPIEGFPDSFDGCLTFVEEYEGTRRPPNAYSAQIDETLIQAFSRRHLPKPLQPLGRTLVLSLLPEATVINLGLKLPSGLTRRLFRNGLKIFLGIQEKLLPDPRMSHPELIRMKTGASIEDYVRVALGGVKTQPKTAG